MVNGDSHSPRSSSHNESGLSATMKKNILLLGSSNSKNMNFGVPEDDIHVCIQCLRAIMNNTVRKFAKNFRFLPKNSKFCRFSVRF